MVAGAIPLLMASTPYAARLIQKYRKRPLLVITLTNARKAWKKAIAANRWRL